MAFRAIWSQDRIYLLPVIAVLLAIPVVTVLAWRGWAKRVRKDLPRWRNVLAVISILSTFVSWLAFLSPFLLSLIGIDTHRFADACLSAAFLMMFAGIPLAFALRGTSRVRTLLAGLLMVALWFASVVH
ncbi:MAG: hypothetical protein DMG32_16885 [Acidobacteria bacterium]|nr:MAG: hypothetical protein DMG32_16885 [Acidobacteriota bacterium]